MNHPVKMDEHTQLRRLYSSLLAEQARFDEFKQLLALYTGLSPDEDEEPAEAAEIRKALNDRIREWVGAPLDDLSAVQVLIWKAIIVENRINIAVSPWKESNGY